MKETHVYLVNADGERAKVCVMRFMHHCPVSALRAAADHQYTDFDVVLLTDSKIERVTSVRTADY